MTYLYLLLLKRLEDSIHGRIGQETQIPAAGLHVLGFGLEFAAGLVEVDLLGTEDECVPSARSGRSEVRELGDWTFIAHAIEEIGSWKVGWEIFSTW